MLPKQILLTNFITDFPYLSIASDNVDNEQMSVPGKYLTILSFVGILTTIALPYMNCASKLGLVPLSTLNLASIIMIVFAYIFSADFLKVWFFKKYSEQFMLVHKKN